MSQYKLLALIPARGSERLKHKNIKNSKIKLFYKFQSKMHLNQKF